MAFTAPIELDLGLLYALVSFVCLIIVAIILNRITSTDYKEVIDRHLVVLCRFFLLFGAVDTVWGLFESRLLLNSAMGLMVTTYVFLFMSFLSAYIWTGYMMHFMGVSGKAERNFNILHTILFLLQFLLLLFIIWAEQSSSLGETGEYMKGTFRTNIFYLQFIYYLSVLGYAIVRLLDGRSDREQFKSAALFSFIPFAFGVLMMIFPNGPFYTAGFTVTAVAIYSYNITSQREKFIEDLAEANAQVQLSRVEKEHAAEMEVAMKAAEAANQAKSAFLFNMSHDIRTPMNAILGFTDMAKRNADDKEKLMDCLDKVSISSSHLLSIMNDVLDMSRIENGKVVIEEKPVWLKKCGADLLTMVRELAKQKDIELVVEDETPDGLCLYADEMHMNRIFMNVFSNAIKYSPGGSRVYFSIRNVQLSEPGKVRLESVIRDEGIGMAPEFLEHIFESFSRERTATVSGIQGTGLGMAITKQLVDLIGGEIAIESEQGVGTTVKLAFELREAEGHGAASASDEGAGAGATLEGRRVLLVEDNELNREIACDLLSDEGMEADEAGDGTEAVEMYRKSLMDGTARYDFILMDIQMPVMNGYQATELIRQMEKPLKCHIPIIAMTANAFAEDEQNSLRAGMDAHLSKPVNVDELMETLRRFL